MSCQDSHDCSLHIYNGFLDLLWDDDRRTVVALQRPDQYLHLDAQDYACAAWQKLLDLIEESAQDGRPVFNPREELGWELWSQIKELPPEIGKLTQVKELMLYGSNLVRIPPEIGDMESLEVFTPYTSYSLHWFPYEITNCKKLKKSTVSPRALYGNYKYRSPFPELNDPDDIAMLKPQTCSVCGAQLNVEDMKQVWVSLQVAQEVLPLLVNACSQACIDALPAGASGYITIPHEGGCEVVQPLLD